MRSSSGIEVIGRGNLLKTAVLACSSGVPIIPSSEPSAWRKHLTSLWSWLPHLVMIWGWVVQQSAYPALHSAPLTLHSGHAYSETYNTVSFFQVFEDNSPLAWKAPQESHLRQGFFQKAFCDPIPGPQNPLILACTVTSHHNYLFSCLHLLLTPSSTKEETMFLLFITISPGPKAVPGTLKVCKK